jgi:hypothetical protein
MPLGSDKAMLMPLGPDEVEPVLWVSGKATVMPLSHPSEAIVDYH